MSQTLKKVGVVVVGLGIAGRVRVRDIKEQANGFTLRGVVSRRPVEIENVQSMTFEEAVTREDVQALLICTEPALHEECVQKGLNQNKHVLVEYPLALSAAKAKEFHQIAAEKGLVLWEENIALLTESHLAVKAKAATSRITAVNFSLLGTYNGWMEDFEKSGLPFISGISGIECMVDLMGADLNVVNASMTKRDDCYTAKATLETQDHRPISMTLSRTADKSGTRRTKVVQFDFEDGETIDTSKFVSTNPPQKQGLFMQDLKGFHQAVLSGKLPDKAKDLTIASMEIAEKIHSLF